MILRIEDIDSTRCRAEYEDAIFEDLRWLGLDWQGEVWRQSQRMPVYQAALHRLAAQELLYPCFCTRTEIQAEIARMDAAPHDLLTPDGLRYPGTCRSLSGPERSEKIARGAPYALRLDMHHALHLAGRDLFFIERGHHCIARPEMFGDVVLARKETPTSYHLAVTVDDAAQGITLITRAEDLLPATHLHRLLQQLLNLPVPEYRHFPLLLGQDGKRLSKRDGARSLADLRAAGISPAAVLAQATAGLDFC